jgi:peptide/nickel transport system substrate-binding protein
VPGAPEFDRNSVVFYPYAPDASKALLAEIGFEDTDGNGFLNWTSGPLEGEDLAIAMMAGEDAQEGVNLGQALVNTFAQVGIKVNFRPVTSAALLELNVSGEWETHIDRVEHERVLPFAKADDLVPLGKNAPNWHVEGDTPRQLQPFEEEMVDLLNQYLKENDLAKRKELINQLNHIWTENVYTLGIWVGRHGLALAKRFQNVPSGTPVFMYQWVEDNYLAESIWSPVEEQLPEVRPNTIPVYNTQ